MKKFYRMSVRTDWPDETDDVRGWSHEIRGPVVCPHGIICYCLTREIADEFCEWLNSALHMKLTHMDKWIRYAVAAGGAHPATQDGIVRGIIDSIKSEYGELRYTEEK